MHDRLEPPDRVRVADQLFATSFVAIDLAVDRRAGKRRLDRRDRLALVEPMHHRVGIVHRHAGLAEESRRGRLAHADRAGEAEDEHHVVFARMSASIMARCSGITFGATPNQWVKPGTAW